MPKFFIDGNQNYYETLDDLEVAPAGSQPVPQRPSPFDTWNGSAWEAGSAPVPTSAELDALADRVSDDMLEQDAKMKALALVMADLVERAFNVSPQVARQQVKTRFRTYYRGLLDR